jgi:hypothetical protein
MNGSDLRFPFKALLTMASPNYLIKETIFLHASFPLDVCDRNSELWRCRTPETCETQARHWVHSANPIAPRPEERHDELDQSTNHGATHPRS